MIRRIWHARPHLDPEVVAELVDGGPDAVDARVLEHLADCPRCMAAWAATARQRGEILRHGAPPVAPRSWRRRAAGKPRLLRVAGALAAATLAAAAVLTLMVLPDAGVTPFQPEAPLAGLLPDASAGGMIFPGVSASPSRTGLRLRSGDRNGPALNHFLTDLGRRRLVVPHDLSVNRQLVAGWTLAGQPRTASAVAREALRTHADDPVLRHLAAIAAWRESRLADAEELLHALHAEHPDDEIVGFNLALLLHEIGRESESRALLDALAADAANPLVRARATAFLAPA